MSKKSKSHRKKESKKCQKKVKESQSPCTIFLSDMLLKLVLKMKVMNKT